MRVPFTAACGLAWLASVACTAPQDPLNAAMPAPSATVVVAPPPSTTPDRCFGDSPPEAIARDVRPKDLFASASVVLWRSGELIHRMDPATGRTSTFDASSLIFIVAADSRDVFGATPVLDLVAIDLSSGQSRAVSRSSGWTTGSATRNLPAVVTLFGARYVLDRDYVYVAWHPDPATYSFYSQSDHVRTVKGPHDLGDLARVKRDGSSAPEYLGRGPDGRFIVSDGYAYWGSQWEGIKRRALVPGAANEVLWAAPDVPYLWPIGVSAGRVYFSRVTSPDSPHTFSIESVPAVPAETDGGAVRPHVHVASAGLPFGDGLLDGKCVYAGGPAGVTRANLEDGTVQPLIEGRPVPGDLTGLHSQFLATDGRFLYWADNGGDRVVRWRR